MLNNLNIKKLVKHIPQNLISFNSKIVIYVGLLAYWGVILAGTILQIN
tara:strand:- start:711 stop:854 length:144 start_codon:yes stop_codon:yes gene_type:complete